MKIKSHNYNYFLVILKKTIKEKNDQILIKFGKMMKDSQINFYLGLD